jgi:AcrR family transcriptional regulator
MSAAERRELVLDAAVTEFAVHGLAGTSTEDVARRAGISQPYLFRLFPTKKTLFVELVDRCYRRVEQTFTAAADDRTAEEALEAMGNGYKRLLDDRTLLLRQMHVYAACDDPGIQAAARAVQAPMGTDRASDRPALPAGGGVLRHGHAHERRRRAGPAAGR